MFGERRKDGGYIRERIRASAAKENYEPIANTEDEVWVWAKDKDGAISGKTIPRSWLKEDDILVDVARVNLDLARAKAERGIRWLEC